MAFGLLMRHYKQLRREIGQICVKKKFGPSSGTSLIEEGLTEWEKPQKRGRLQFKVISPTIDRWGLTDSVKWDK